MDTCIQVPRCEASCGGGYWRMASDQRPESHHADVILQQSRYDQPGRGCRLDVISRVGAAGKSCQPLPRTTLKVPASLSREPEQARDGTWNLRLVQR
jgi:hypothetical protein